jgi:hypothetical protein
MSSFAEFMLIAAALFLWESTLWLPLHGVALRRAWNGRTWKVLDPTRLFVTKNLGLVPMWPLPPDAGLAPCQAPPLMVDPAGNWLTGSSFLHDDVTWSGIREEPSCLCVAGAKVRISSPRCIGVLRRAKKRGATPEAAVRQSWRLALNPGRAAREWRRWQRASGSLRWYGPVLTLGFFIGLPMVYIHRGGLPTVMFALGLWCLMVWTAGYLWWLGRRVYPDARSALRMDALLALLVPFHAMRALEIASVHAMGTTHPAALMLATRDLENPWLSGFIRRILHPAGNEETAHAHTLRPLLETALARCGKHLGDYDAPPIHHDDAQARRYCPRCHGLYLETVRACADCQGLELRMLPPSIHAASSGS